jgi:hypothetical protein
LGLRQYARILAAWIDEIGFDPPADGTHTMRRTKSCLIHGHTKKKTFARSAIAFGTKLESSVWYPGIEVEDALELSEQTEI